MSEEESSSYPPYNFSWLVENKIAGMGFPGKVGNLNYLVDVGIKHLITLSPERWPPMEQCMSLKWTEIPIKEFGTPSIKQIIKFINICERAEIRGEPVGVHCRQGRGRTGVMLACYLVYKQNMAPERAVYTVRTIRPGSCETYLQEKMVCHYHDCLRGTIDVIDYTLVDNKQLFDAEYPKPIEIKTEPQKEDGAKTEVNEKPKKERKKTKAMVINHKIYF